MSTWTHVNGSIRIDSIRLPGVAEPNFEELLGRQVDPFDKDWETTLPCGSEGSLTWHVWTNPKENEMAAYVVSIFGDLRDYNSFDGIEAWFTKVCSQFTAIRSAVLEIEIEWEGVRLYRYNPCLGRLPDISGIEKIHERMENDGN